MRRRFGYARLLLATLGIVSLTGYFTYSLGVATFAIANFFTYFTVLSAMAAVLVLLTAGITALRHPRDPAWLDMCRAMVTTYMLVSGVVYAIIVMQSAGANYSIAVPWSSQLLHFWIPTLALIDWFVDPHTTRVPWRHLGWVIVFPVLWLVFTLVRGPLVGWYPYFFLDSRLVSGPGETVFYCAIIVGIITGISALLVGLTRLERMPFHLRAPWSSRARAAAAAASNPADASDASDASDPERGRLLRAAERLERVQG